MTHLFETRQGFEVDPDGSLSDPAGLVSAWPFTEMGGIRKDLRGHFDLASTGGMESLVNQAGPGFSTSVKHESDLSVMSLDGNNVPNNSAGGYNRNLDSFPFALCNTDWGYTSAFSLSFWFNSGVLQAGSTSSLAGLFSLTNNDLTNGFYCALRPGTSLDKIGITNSALSAYDLETPESIAADTWYFVCLTFDGTTKKLYLDGATAVTATGATGPTAATTSGKLTFGQLSKGSDAYRWTFYGKMCHAAMWKKALTATQVATLYNSGTPNRYKTWITEG